MRRSQAEAKGRRSQDATAREPPRREPPRHDPSETFAVRLPYYVAQCQSFQVARQTWTRARPCCLANGFLEPVAPPSGLGEACYERLTEEQRRRFWAYVEAAEATGRIRRYEGSEHFLKLLRPEQHAMFPHASSSGKRRKLLKRRRPLEEAPSMGAASSTEVSQPAPADARDRVGGLHWCEQANCWEVEWIEGERLKRKRFMVNGSVDSAGETGGRANANALGEAIAFRAGLVKDGKLKVAGQA